MRSCQAVQADNTAVYYTNAVETLSGYTRPVTTRVRNRAPPAPHHEEYTNGDWPEPLRRRWRWVSLEIEEQIETAWGSKGRTRCQIYEEERASHCSLKLHVNAHLLLTFCPCGYNDVYPYPVTRHWVTSCFFGENYVVDAKLYPEFLTLIRPLVKKAMLLAVLTSGFQHVLDYARQQSRLVSDRPQIVYTPEEFDYPEEEEVFPPPTRRRTRYPGSAPLRRRTPSPDPARLATVEERLFRLQAEFTQLATDLLSTTKGLYQIKGSVDRIKRKLRARQAKHRLAKH